MSLSLQSLAQLKSQPVSPRMAIAKEQTAPAEQGLSCLQQALATRFSQPELLSQSLCAFQEALRLNPHHATALCGMAYLLALSGDRVKARLYATQVLEQDLDHPLAQALWTSLQNQDISADSGRPRYGAVVSCDYDAQYEALKRLLNHSLRLYSQASLTRVLRPASPERDRLGQTITELERLLFKVNQHLQLIEQELDTHELERLKHPLQQILGRLLRLQQAFATHDAIFAAIRQGQQECRTLMTVLYAASASHQLESRLSELLDACDAVADRLDALYAQKYELPELRQAYRHWMSEVQMLQDQIDENH